MTEAAREYDGGNTAGSGPMILSLVIGGVLAGVVFVALQRWERSMVSEAFDAVATGGARAIEYRTLHHVQALSVGGAFYRAARPLGGDSFGDYAEGVLSRRPDRVLMVWVPRVADQTRDVFERAAREEGLPDYRIIQPNSEGNPMTAPRRAEYFPVRYAEPAHAGEGLLGLDMSAQARFRKVIEAAGADGRLRASGRIPLSGQAQQGQYGFALFRPVYRTLSVGRTPAERGARLDGFFALLIDTGALVREALAEVVSGTTGVVVTDEDAAQDRARDRAHDKEAV